MRRFQGKAVVVTGGAAGIGAAICRRFYQEGAKVWVADVNAKGAAATARAIEEQEGGQAEEGPTITPWEVSSSCPALCACGWLL